MEFQPGRLFALVAVVNLQDAVADHAPPLGPAKRPQPILGVGSLVEVAALGGAQRSVTLGRLQGVRRAAAAAAHGRRGRVGHGRRQGAQDVRSTPLKNVIRNDKNTSSIRAKILLCYYLLILFDKAGQWIFKMFFLKFPI